MLDWACAFIHVDGQSELTYYEHAFTKASVYAIEVGFTGCLTRFRQTKNMMRVHCFFACSIYDGVVTPVDGWPRRGGRGGLYKGPKVLPQG